MARIHSAAQQAGMARIWADVSLNAEPFFSRSGFAVEARQQVALRGQVLANARMSSKQFAFCFFIDSCLRSLHKGWRPIWLIFLIRTPAQGLRWQKTRNA